MLSGAYHLKCTCIHNIKLHKHSVNVCFMKMNLVFSKCTVFLQEIIKNISDLNWSFLNGAYSHTQSMMTPQLEPPHWFAVFVSSHGAFVTSVHTSAQCKRHLRTVILTNFLNGFWGSILLVRNPTETNTLTQTNTNRHAGASPLPKTQQIKQTPEKSNYQENK